MRYISCQNNRNIYKSIIRKPNVSLLKSPILQNSNNKNKTTKISFHHPPFPPRRKKALAQKTKMVRCAHFFLSSCCSIKAGPRVLQVRRCSRGRGSPAGREVLHPPSRGHRNLLVPVAVHSRPEIQAVGLGGNTGK